MLTLHMAKETWLHRVPAWFKLLALSICGSSLLLVEDLGGLAAACALTLIGYGSLGRAAWQHAKRLRAVVALALAIAVFHVLFLGTPAVGAASALRLVTGITLATMLTLTTRFDELLDVLEKLLDPLQALGVPTARLAIALALVLRFVAVLQERWQRLDDSHRARTGRSGGLRLFAPLTIRALQTAEQVADALTVRLGR